MKIELLETAGWYTVFKNLRQSYSLDTRSECKHNTAWQHFNNNETKSSIWNKSEVEFDNKDLQLLSTLVKRGDSHSKIIRGLQTYVEITAPRYWWMEFLTYNIGVLELNPTIDWVSLNSESTMHTLSKQELQPSMVTEDVYNDTIQAYNYSRMDTMDNNISKEKILKRCKANLPEGYLQTRTFQVSYQAWRRVYQQRHDHKLEEWSKDMIEFIESLPFSKELILVK